MTRRTLFGRLLVAASAFVVAPAVTVEAAPGHGVTCLCEMPGCLGSTPEGRALIEQVAIEQAQARAEGYERGRAVEQASAESRAMQDGFLWMPTLSDQSSTPRDGAYCLDTNTNEMYRAVGGRWYRTPGLT